MSGVDEEVSLHEFAQFVQDAIEAGNPTPEPTAPEPTVDANGRAHGDDGRFLPSEPAAEELEDPDFPVVPEKPDETPAEPAAEAPAEEPATEEPTEEELELYLEDDPDVLKLVTDKYKGNVTEALRASLEAQSLIGRQSQELAESRALQTRVQQLEQMLLQQQQFTMQQQMLPRVDEAMIEDNPAGAAQLAYQAQDWISLERAVDAWREDDPYAAALFVSSLQYEQLRAEMAQQQQQQIPSGPSFAQETAEVIKRHPDLEKFLPAIGEIARERPVLGALLNDENAPANTRAQALEDLYLIARSRQSADTSADAVRKIALRTRAEADAAKADAAVVTGGKSGAASAAKSGTDAFLDAFGAHLGLEED